MKKKKKTMKREKSVIVRDITGGGREQNLTSVLKVPRHCPFVLLISVSISPVLLKFNFMALGWGACRLNLNRKRSLTGCIRAKIFEVTIGRAACEACRAAWDLGTN
jgi:hypothetical protein